MTKKKALSMAIGALQLRMNEKSWDAEHVISDYGRACEKFVREGIEAVRILEMMKDEERRQAE